MNFLRRSKFYSNSSRHYIKIDNSRISKKNRFARTSIKNLHFKNGRCFFFGKITAWHKGGGPKNLFRKLNFSNTNYNCIVLNLQYDPCRNSFIFLNFDLVNYIFFRTTALINVFPGALLNCNLVIQDLKLGSRTKITNIPIGSIIHNLSRNYYSIAQFIRSAGTKAQIIQKNKQKAILRLPSNLFIRVSVHSFASIGIISNLNKKYTVLGKAGRNRLLGNRPITRGIAMNPVDHPHGGRTNGGCPSVTPWGLPTKSGFRLKRKKN